MERGYVKIYRKLLDSQVFQNDGLLKVWLWCLMRANHKKTWVRVTTGKGTTEVELQAGQFIFGRDTAAKELKMKPTTIRDRMKKLTNMQNLTMQSATHYSLVSIVNWGEYQDTDEMSASQSATQPPPNRHPTATDKNDKNEKKKEPGKISGPATSLEDLRQKYPDQSLLDQVFHAIASTRQRGKVADSVLLAQLKAWDRYPVEQVENAMKTYLQKGYANQGKKENYLLGIIRNGSKAQSLGLSPGREWYEEDGAI
jgi:hypothetical protein